MDTNNEEKKNSAAKHGKNKNKNEGVREGPSFFVTVPENYTEEEMREVLDALLKLPSKTIGNAVVVREGVTVAQLDPYPEE